MTLRLIHRTNYWGQRIDANDGDDDVNFDAIWVQAMIDGKRCCCPGFGERRVAVDNQDISDEHSSWWSLFLVNGRRGRSEAHYFYKFVLIPQGTHGYGKRGCADRGWRFQGQVLADRACEDLDDLLRSFFDDASGDVNHVHIGIMMDQLCAGKGNSG